MRVLAFSDWRVQSITDLVQFVHRLEPPVDIILYAGDDVGRFDEGATNYFSELAHLTSQRKVLAVIGNDDTPDVRKALAAEGVHDLYQSPFIWKNYGFIGLEAATSGPAIVLHTEEEVAAHLAKRYRALKGKRLIVLSHTPPYGILDRGIRFAPLTGEPYHIGSTSLRKFVERREPVLVVCGHCHSQGGRSEELGRTLVLNTASHDDPGSDGVFVILDIGESVKCDWHRTSEFEESGSLRGVHGIGFRRRDRLLQAGISTIEVLAHLQDLREISARSGLSVKLLETLRLRALSVFTDTVYRTREFVPPPDSAIFFDIETDLQCKRVWMIGVLQSGRYRKFYAEHWDEEKPILEAFLRFISRPSVATLVSYSGTGFDRRILCQAMARHHLDYSVFHTIPHVDLCHALKSHFILPTSSFRLKEVGSKMGYPFKHPDLDGFWVALAYEEHIRRRTPIDFRLLEYNQDDVRVLPYLIRRLTALDSFRPFPRNSLQM